MKTKEIMFGLITVGLSLLFCLIILEIALRFLPVNEGLRTQEVTQAQPVHKFTPDDDLRWSRDWDFSVVTRLRVNNAGFVNKYDYTPHGVEPVFAVIGDSYVEAAQVPYELSFYGLLENGARNEYGGRFHVYSFGAGGAPLSQYLVFARHARENYNVKAMTIVIIGNDFDESLPKYRWQETFHQFVRNDAGEYDLKLLHEYRPTGWKQLLRQSALVRYFYFNANLWRAWGRIENTLMSRGNNGENRYVGNTVAQASPERIADSRAAIDAFFRLLPDYAGLPRDEILFVVDPPRSLIYEGKNAAEDNSYVSQMRRYFMGKAIMEGYEVADLLQPFAKKYAENGQRFEWPADGHWNAAGHEVAYEAIKDSLVYSQFVKETEKRN